MSTDEKKIFWNTFSHSNWEKKPILLKNFKTSVSEIDEKQIFLMLVEYSNICRQKQNPEGFKLYINSQRQNDSDILQILPEKNDGTLKNYHLRMEAIFSDYCLVCDELLQVSFKNWQKLNQFTKTLFDHVGFPNRFIEMGLYLGNYRKTPFGVHVDGCGVFSFPVLGKKIFRLWKPDFVKKNPELDRALNYSKYKKNSQIIKASPGDMTYWPSSAWHIAESQGTFSATWSLGVWVDKSHQENITDLIQPLLALKLGKNGNATLVKKIPNSKVGQKENLPTEYFKSIKAIKSISSAELHDACLVSWLKLKSLQGFKNQPQQLNTLKISMKNRIQLNETSSILWTSLKSKLKIVYAFQGSILECSPSKSLEKLILDLNKNKQCVVADYLKGPAKIKDLALLQQLAKWGAFVKF